MPMHEMMSLLRQMQATV